MQQFLEIQDRKATRSFVDPSFSLTDWEHLKPYYDQLYEAELDSAEALESFLHKLSELEAIVWEEFAWLYIRMTCDTQDKQNEEAYQFFLKEIHPHLSEYKDKLNRKVSESSSLEDLDPDVYKTLLRKLKRDIKLFRKENIPLGTELEGLSLEYKTLMGGMTIEHDGETLTIPKAAKLLEKKDREMRQEVWEKVAKRRNQDKQQMQDIFTKMVAKRTQMARNAGYDTYTQYKFDSLGRFDYSLEDTYSFHESVEKVVKPLYQEFMKERKERLGLDKLRPWDLSVDIFGEEPLKPFQTGKELLDKSVDALSRLQPELGEMIRIMDHFKYLDLESREGKAPGGYNYPLMETGIPFIFMNATGTQTDVITMLHESGHAIHSFLTRNISLNEFKDTPSEVAELASMSMELLCLDAYDVFYDDKATEIRARKNQLMRCIDVFPWIAAVDCFQQWVYDNPEHSQEERNEAWGQIHHRFHGDVVDWSGYEDLRKTLWIKQGHIFDVPFYYIEYGIAQLGALAVWRNYKENPSQGLTQYLEALQMGYTQPIPQIYEKAGIRFDFSPSYVKESIDFCMAEYKKLASDN